MPLGIAFCVTAVLNVYGLLLYWLQNSTSEVILPLFCYECSWKTRLATFFCNCGYLNFKDLECQKVWIQNRYVLNTSFANQRRTYTPAIDSSLISNKETHHLFTMLAVQLSVTFYGMLCRLDVL